MQCLEQAATFTVGCGSALVTTTVFLRWIRPAANPTMVIEAKRTLMRKIKHQLGRNMANFLKFRRGAEDSWRFWHHLTQMRPIQARGLSLVRKKLEKAAVSSQPSNRRYKESWPNSRSPISGATQTNKQTNKQANCFALKAHIDSFK